jgi:outer membrane biosynthesis protein TonB
MWSMPLAAAVRRAALLAIVLVVCGAWDFARRKNPDVERGNAHYKAGEWDEAIAAYRKALERLPDEPGAHYDLGAALYQKGVSAKGKDRDALLEQAEHEFRLGTDTSDPRLKSDAHHNLGNTLSARGRDDEAITEYKKALKIDPHNEAARRNLELLLRKKKEQQKQDQQTQDQQNDQQQPPQAPQDQQPPQQSQDQQPPQDRQPPQDQNDQQPQPPQDQPSDQPQPQQPQQPQPQPQQPQPQQPQQDPSHARPDRAREGERGDEAGWKLDALERRSKDLQIQKQRQRANERRRGRQVKDW